MLFYPFFKLAWYARYAEGFKQAIGKFIMSFFGWLTISNKLPDQSGKTIKVPIQFEPMDLDSFKEVFWGGEYDTDLDLSQCKSLVDLGGNTGMVPLHFASKSQLEKILIVEANEGLIPVIEKNTNGLPSSVNRIISNCCVSGKDHGVITFYIPDNHRMSSTSPIEGAKKVNVEKVPLRELMQKHGFEQVDILKMDIEGSEFEIMQDDPQIFKRFKYLFIEIHGDQAKRQSFHAFMGSLGAKLKKQKEYSEDSCETSVFVF